MEVFDRLFDDARLLAGHVLVAALIEDRRGGSAEWYAALAGAVVVPDTRLAELDRAAAAAGVPVEVSVVNTSGAGGLVALAGRRLTAVDLVAVESAVRDLDDPAGNAARVVSAAAALDEGVTVYVEISPVPGARAAIEAVEAAGLCGKVRIDGPTGMAGGGAGLARQLSDLIEADLPFKIAGEGPEPVALLAAVAALVDGAGVSEAGALLATAEPARLATAAGRWDQATQRRIRRRVRRVDVPTLAAAAERLDRLGVEHRS